MGGRCLSIFTSLGKEIHTPGQSCWRAVCAAAVTFKAAANNAAVRMCLIIFEKSAEEQRLPSKNNQQYLFTPNTRAGLGAAPHRAPKWLHAVGGSPHLTRLPKQIGTEMGKNMRRLTLLLITAFVLSSGPAYGNPIYKQFAGRWKVETQNIEADKSSVRFTATARIQVLKSGTIYSEIKRRMRGKVVLAKFWSYPNGKYRATAYLNGKKSGDSRGSYTAPKRIGHSKWTSKSTDSDGTTSNSVLHKISRNKFVNTVTSSDGSRNISTHTRIGN